MDSIIDIFQHLDAVSRRNTLTQLVPLLRQDEVSTLSTLITEHNDPLNRLPLELVIMVFERLPMLDTWRLQLVCKNWHHILSKDRLQATAIGRYDTHDEDDSANTIDPPVKVKVRHWQAMRQGRPFYLAHINDTPCKLGRPPRVALKRDTIAYVRQQDGMAREVVTRNLLTGRTNVFTGLGRETVQAFDLSSSLIAFVTHAGMLYTAKHRHNEHHMTSCRLPSSAVSALSTSKDKVLLLLPSGDSSSFHNTIACYDTWTGELRAFEFASQTIEVEKQWLTLKADKLLYDAAEDSIDIFSSERPREREVVARTRVDPDYGNSIELRWVGHMRFVACSTRKHGIVQPIAQGQISVQQLDVDSTSVVDVLPTGDRATYELRLPRNGRHGGMDTIRFNRRTATLFVQGEEPGEASFIRQGCDLWTDYRPHQTFSHIDHALSWKDTYTTHQTRSQFRTFAPRHAVLRPQEIIDRGLFLGCAGRTDYLSSRESFSAARNDSFLVCFEFAHDRKAGAICVHSFQEHLRLSSGLPTGSWREKYAHYGFNGCTWVECPSAYQELIESLASRSQQLADEI